MLDKNKFVELMANTAAMYNITLTEFMYDVYYDIFKENDYDKLEKAFREMIKNHKYHTFPKPAEILEYLEGTRDDKALVAWMQLKEAVVKGGYYASIEFADPIIPHCVNELGGWTWFCNQEKDNLPFIEKRFMDLYRLFLKRGVKDNFRLIGFIEATNKEKGCAEIPAPIRIGFVEEQKKLTTHNATACNEG